MKLAYFISLLTLCLTVQAQIPGTFRVNAPIAPPATNSIQGSHIPRYGYGGTLTGGALAQAQDLNWYPSTRRHPGQLFCDTNNLIVYQLDSDLTTWQVLDTALVFTNVSSLVAFDPSRTKPNTTFVTLGRDVPGIGAAGYYYDSTSVVATNRGTAFACGAAGRILWNQIGTANVYMFGATNSATADNSTAIQAAVDTLGYGYLGIGNFGISTPINIASNRRLYGENYIPAVLTMTADNTPALTVDGAFNSVHDIRLHKSSIADVSQTSSAGIRFGTAYRFGYMDNIFIDGFYNGVDTTASTAFGWFQNWLTSFFIFDFANSGAVLGGAGGNTQSYLANWYIKGALTSPSYVVSAATNTGAVVTITFTGTHNLEVGQYVTLSAFTPSTYNGSGFITSLVTNTFTLTLLADPGAYVSGGLVTTSWSGADKTGSAVVLNGTDIKIYGMNIEWIKAPHAIEMNNSKADIQGLHIEGFVSTDTTNTYVIGNRFRPSSIKGWEFINTWVRAGLDEVIVETGSGFPTEPMTMDLTQGQFRDIYIPTNSTLGIARLGSVLNHRVNADDNRITGTIRANATPVITNTLAVQNLTAWSQTNNVPLPLHTYNIGSSIESRVLNSGVALSQLPGATDGYVVSTLGTPDLNTNDFTVSVVVDVPKTIPAVVAAGNNIGIWTLGSSSTGLFTAVANSWNLSLLATDTLQVGFNTSAASLFPGTFSGFISRFGGKRVTLTVVRGNNTTKLYADGTDLGITGFVTTLPFTNQVTGTYFVLGGRRGTSDLHWGNFQRATLWRKALTREEVIASLDTPAVTSLLPTDYQIPNGDFETAGAPFGSWSTFTSGLTTIAQTNDAYSGTSSAVIYVGSDSGSGQIYQSTITIPGKSYRVFFAAKQATSTNGGVLFGNQTTINAYYDTGSSALTTNWQTFSFDFVASNTRFTTGRSGGSSASSTVQIDDIILYELQPWMDLVPQAGNGTGMVDQSMSGRPGVFNGVSGWLKYQPQQTAFSANQGDASITVLYYFPPIIRFDTALTANRTVTITTTGMYPGQTFKIVRTGLGAFTLDVGGLKTIPNSTAATVDVLYDGTAMKLIGYQPL
jgi:hypothetical protein